MKQEDTKTGTSSYVGNLDRAKVAKDLETRKTLNTNPLPERGCGCCGRRLSELTPFQGCGADGLLLKRKRGAGPYDEEAERAYREANNCFEAEGYTDPLDWMVAKYGKEEGERLELMVHAYSCVGSSWECRDCVGLDEDEYFERLRIRFQEKQEPDGRLPEEPGAQ
jgi:hypothetical protein